MKYDEEGKEYSLDVGNIKIQAPLDPNISEICFTMFGQLGIAHPYNLFLPAQRKEIADYMITLWKEWAK